MIRCFWRPVHHITHHALVRRGIRHLAHFLPHRPGWRLVWTCIVTSGLAGGGVGWGVGNAMLPPTPVAPDVWAGPDIAGGGAGDCCVQPINADTPAHRVPEPSSLAILGGAVLFALAVWPVRR